MIALHDVDASDVNLPALATYGQKRYDPPRWTNDPVLWERAVELFHERVPTSDVGGGQLDERPSRHTETAGAPTGSPADPWFHRSSGSREPARRPGTGRPPQQARRFVNHEQQWFRCLSPKVLRVHGLS